MANIAGGKYDFIYALKKILCSFWYPVQHHHCLLNNKRKVSSFFNKCFFELKGQQTRHKNWVVVHNERFSTIALWNRIPRSQNIDSNSTEIEMKPYTLAFTREKEQTVRRQIKNLIEKSYVSYRENGRSEVCFTVRWVSHFLKIWCGYN